MTLRQMKDTLKMLYFSSAIIVFALICAFVCSCNKKKAERERTEVLSLQAYHKATLTKIGNNEILLKK